eukprot:jgi/Chrzof1/11005/Cz05g20040.t1
MAEVLLVVCISSAGSNVKRRNALRRSWFRYTTTEDSCLTDQQRNEVVIKFVVSYNCGPAIAAEISNHHDIVLVDVEEGYHKLWRKACAACLEDQ